MTNTLFPELFSLGSLKIRFSLLRFEAVFSLKKVLLTVDLFKENAVSNSTPTVQCLVFLNTALRLGVVLSTFAVIVVLTRRMKAFTFLSVTESLDHYRDRNIFDTEIWHLNL